MAGDGGTCGEHRRHTARLPGQPLVANGVDPTMDPSQAPHLRRLRCGALRIPEASKLTRRNHAVLLRRQLEKWLMPPFPLTLVAHRATKDKRTPGSPPCMGVMRGLSPF